MKNEIEMKFDVESEGGGSAAVLDTPPIPDAPSSDISPAPLDGKPSSDAPPVPQDDPSKTYTGKELGEIVSKRLSEELKKHGVEEWKTIGVKPDEARAKLARLNELERAFGGEKKSEKVDSPEDAKVKEWMYSKFPELKEIQAIRERAAIADDRGYAQVARVADDKIDSMSKEAFGVTDNGQLLYFRNQVAASIMSNREDAQKWFKTGDMAVVDKHFKAIKEAMEPILRATAAKYVTDKKALESKIPPRMPPGGVTEPSSSKKTLTDDERVRGGFAFLREQAARGE